LEILGNFFMKLASSKIKFNLDLAAFQVHCWNIRHYIEHLLNCFNYD